MTTTLGEALTAKDVRYIDVKDTSIDDGFDSAKKELNKGGKAINRKALQGALKKAIMTSLDVALDEIIGQAWSHFKDLRKYADPDQTPPDDINTLTLSDHSIESVHEPTVDVVVHGIPVHKFKFSVSASLNVKGANLEVQRGRIQAIQLADLELGGSVMLHDHTLFEKSVAKVAIPAEMRLKNPIKISMNDR